MHTWTPLHRSNCVHVVHFIYQHLKWVCYSLLQRGYNERDFQITVLLIYFFFAQASAAQLLPTNTCLHLAG